jgi:hypothetical protein
MRGRRWLRIGNVGLVACLLSGCLRGVLPPDAEKPRSDVPTSPAQDSSPEVKRPDVSLSDYQLSRPPVVQLDARPPISPVKAVELRIPSQEPTPPAPPAAPPEARMDLRPAPPAKLDAPSVQALRALLERHPDEEVREPLKRYDPATRAALLVLLESVAQMEQGGGIAQLSPRDLAAWMERLNGLTGLLRSKAQLMLDKMCFCSRIESFGQFKPLENTCFQPGEDVHVYVQVRNFASRSRKGGGYSTALKGKLEIYDEYNSEKPFMCWHSQLHTDDSWTPRQDYFVNFRFQVPRKCPPGSYTVYITVEDWTEAAPDANEVAKPRIARSSLDFRVGGPIARQPRANINDVAPAR